MKVPAALAWWQEMPGGAACLASLDGIVGDALAWGVSGRKVEGDMIECARLLAAAPT